MRAENGCEHCRYVCADSHGKWDGYRCSNQDSPRFGEIVGKGCDDFERFNPRPKMSLKDALDKIVMLPKGAYNDWFFKFGKEDEFSRPIMWISFESNKEMYDYRDALEVCFEELMRLKKEDGDFEGE